MDGHPRQDPAYRPATESPASGGAFYFSRVYETRYRECGHARRHRDRDRLRLVPRETDPDWVCARRKARDLPHAAAVRLRLLGRAVGQRHDDGRVRERYAGSIEDGATER